MKKTIKKTIDVIATLFMTVIMLAAVIFVVTGGKTIGIITGLGTVGIMGCVMIGFMEICRVVVYQGWKDIFKKEKKNV